MSHGSPGSDRDSRVLKSEQPDTHTDTDTQSEADTDTVPDSEPDSDTDLALSG